jgi:hypothetical protein
VPFAEPRNQGNTVFTYCQGLAGARELLNLSANGEAHRYDRYACLVYSTGPLREMRECLRSTQLLTERSGGIGGKPTPQILVFVLRPYVALAWWFRFSLVRPVVSELCNSTRRIAGIIAHRTNEGKLVGVRPETPPEALLSVRSYSLACSLSMREPKSRYPWFGSLDTLRAMRAFRWGSEWTSCNLNTDSNKASDS